MFSEFLKELERKNIEISFSDGKIKYSGPEENITPDLLDRMKKFKGNLIKYHWPPECVNMMPVNPSGNKIPLVLVYFEIMNYPLSEYMGKEQPFYGFLHYGSRGEKIKYKDVESFAKEYLKQLQKVIPDGPYLLGGFSFGGILAYEMAVQLRNAGYEVPLLALLDTRSPFAATGKAHHKNIFRRIKSNFLGPVGRKIMRAVRMSICRFFLFWKRPVPLFLRNFYIVNTYCDLTTKYSPRKFDGEILLFRLDDPENTDPYYGWESLVKKVNIITYTGTHLSIAREKEYAELIGNSIVNHLKPFYNNREKSGSADVAQ